VPELFCVHLLRYQQKTTDWKMERTAFRASARLGGSL
jgi:hypothetical protein